MHDYRKKKDKQPAWADRKKRMHRNNRMEQDTFTPEGVPITSPLGFGMKEFKDWMFEKTERKESSCKRKK